MFSDFWHFIGYFLILALLLEVIEKIILGDGVAGIIYRDKIEIVNL